MLHRDPNGLPLCAACQRYTAKSSVGVRADGRLTWAASQPKYQDILSQSLCGACANELSVTEVAETIRANLRQDTKESARRANGAAELSPIDLTAFDLSFPSPTVNAAPPPEPMFTTRDLEILNTGCSMLLVSSSPMHSSFTPDELRTVQAKVLRQWEEARFAPDPIIADIRGLTIIHAIKLVRSRKNIGLKDAKDYVEKLEADGLWTRAEHPKGVLTP